MPALTQSLFEADLIPPCSCPNLFGPALTLPDLRPHLARLSRMLLDKPHRGPPELLSPGRPWLKANACIDPDPR
jgi:hypothetical protein